MTRPNPVDTIAGAIMEAVREGLSRSGAVPPSPNATIVPSTLYNRVSAINQSSSSYLRGESSSATNVSGASSSNSSSSTEGTKRRFTIPSMFKPKSKRLKNEGKQKSVSYLRDIFCLPQSLQSKNGSILIPRGTRRSNLANKDIGLLGKIEFQSDWSAERMRREICSVFAKPFAFTYSLAFKITRYI